MLHVGWHQGRVIGLLDLDLGDVQGEFRQVAIGDLGIVAIGGRGLAAPGHQHPKDQDKRLADGPSQNHDVLTPLISDSRYTKSR